MCMYSNKKGLNYVDINKYSLDDSDLHRTTLNNDVTMVILFSYMIIVMIVYPLSGFWWWF